MENLTNEEILEILEAGLEKVASEAVAEYDEYDEEYIGDEYSEEFAKVAHSLGLHPEEFEYIIDAGFEKVAASVKDVWRQAVEKGRGGARRVRDLSGKGIKAFKGLPMPAKVGIGALGASGAGLAALRYRKGRDNALMDVTGNEKIASILEDLTGEEINYLFEQGLEKIAAEEGRIRSALGRLRSGAGSAATRFKGLPRAAQIGIGAAGLGGLGAGAYLAGRKLKRRAGGGIGGDEGEEKIASILEDLTSEEINYLFEQGLEKIAAEEGRIRSALGRLRSGAGSAATRFKGLPRAAQIGIGAAGLGGLGAGAYLAGRKLKRRAGGDEGEEKIASILEDLTSEELGYVFEQGLEKIASEQEEEAPSAVDVIRQMLAE